MKPTIRKCTLDDLPSLCGLARDTYDETFRHLNTPENMKAYLDGAFDPEKLRWELSDAASAFYFLYDGDSPAGYMKLNDSPAQTDVWDPQSLEIERIYVRRKFQGQGFGDLLMDEALKAAAASGKAYVWLGVWEKNEKAIAFYKKHGFDVFGTHAFVMGDEAQTDYIMRKDLK